MNLLYYTGCAAIFSMYAYLALTEHRNSVWFIPAGLALAIAGNLLWMFLVLRLNDSGEIAVAGMVWDLIIVATIILVPAILGIPLAAHKWAGLIIAAIGISIALYK